MSYTFLGGFIITAAAAKLSTLQTTCDGLILFNSAGKLLSDTGLLPEEVPSFPPLKPQNSNILRFFGSFFISVLRPRVVPLVSLILLFYPF